MPTLAGWGFTTEQGADQAVQHLPPQALHAHVVVHDAAIVTWPEGAPAPIALRIRHPRIRGALGRGFWSHLLATVFDPELSAQHPLTLAPRRTPPGWRIGQDAIASIRAEVTAGRSALFVVCRADAPDSLNQLEAALPGLPTPLCRVDLGRPPAAIDLTRHDDRTHSAPPE
jgi:uncharacterized membrane protein